MLRFFGTLAMIILTTLCQSSFISMIPYILTTPNMLLIITFTIGILRGKDEGLLYGLICGLTLDIVTGGLLGFYGLLYMYIGLGCGLLYQLFDVDTPIVPLILTVITEIFYHLYVFLFMYVFRGRLGLGSYMKDIILPELFFTLVVSIVLYGIIEAGNKALEAYEQRSALKFV